MDINEALSSGRYITGTGQNMRVHDAMNCKPPCVIHSPSNHSMKDFPTHWRTDRYLMERICPHGIGHPDPDDLAYKATLSCFQTPMGKKNLEAEGAHGCDGCCQERKAT